MSSAGDGAILITGISGFIGRAMAARLAAAGRRVAGVDLGPRPDDIPGLDQYQSLDVSQPDAGDVLAPFGDIEAIVHGGGISGFMVARDDPRRIFEINVAGTVNLLEFARSRRLRRLVLCSTIMVYGPAQAGLEAATEETAPVPGSVYGASKAAIEALAHGYRAEHGVDVMALRFSHVYGPGRTTECFVRDMVAAALSTGHCRVGQPSGSPRQYVHIEDVCASILAALEAAPGKPCVYNISAGQAHSLAHVRDVVRSAVGPLDVAFDEANEVSPYRLPRLSIHLAARHLGYRPRVMLVEGVARLAQVLAGGDDKPGASVTAGARRG